MNTYSSSKNKFSIIQMHSRDSIHICWLSPLPGAHLEPTDKTALWLCAPSLVSAKCLHQPAPFRSMPPSKRPRSRLVTFPGATAPGSLHSPLRPTPPWLRSSVCICSPRTRSAALWMSLDPSVARTTLWAPTEQQVSNTLPSSARSAKGLDT